MASHPGVSNQCMISGSNVISGGTFIQSIAGDGRKSSFDILTENVAHTAFHNSGARFNPPKCHPNTRVAILQKIMDWARRSDWETYYLHILWLTGAAGAGKSAIAQTIIELCLAEDLIIASFLFFRSDGSRNNAKFLIATLAYQIFYSASSSQKEILSAIDNDPLIFTRDLDYQFDKLIIQPLCLFYSSLDPQDSNHHRIIVLDGLDECLDRHTQAQILHVLRNAIQTHKLPVMFLIASRPEHDINTVFNSKSMEGMFLRLYLDDTYHPDDDIRKYLQETFEEIRTTHPFRSGIPKSWPTTETIETIVQKSSGQFIYAATIIRYVESIRHQPHRRLDIAMNLRPPRGDLPFAQLDTLYTMILSSVEDIEPVLYALSTFSLRVSSSQPLNVPAFMHLDDEELDVLFCDLGALVSVETFNNGYRTLRILHASLHDFLLDPMRSKQFFINIHQYRSRLLADIIDYVAPAPQDDSSNCVLLDSRAECIIDFFDENITLCEISTELMDRVFSFPIVNLFEMRLQGRERDEGCLHITTFVYIYLFPFVSRMITENMDRKWVLIQETWREALDRFFLSQIPLYYAHSELTSFLCLVCHSGKDQFVPGISIDSLGIPTTLDIDYHPAYNLAFHNSDVFLLYILGPEKSHTNPERVTTFLQDSSRSGAYAIGPDNYTKATVSFIDQLKLVPYCPQEGPGLNELHISGQLIFEKEIWRLNVSDYNSNHLGTRAAVTNFLLLGYIIYFLPLCATSPALVQYCQQRTFLTQQVISFFPIRTSLLLQAMEGYLQRIERDHRHSHTQ